jgi:NAD+ kinase
MNLALFGKSVSDNYLKILQEMMDLLGRENATLWLYEPFYAAISGKIRLPGEPVLFRTPAEIRGKIDLFFSIGGDGTTLDATTFVGDTGIPLAGINMGHLGFLSGISREELIAAVSGILHKQYQMDQRTLLKLESPQGLFGDFPYALNELTVYKSNSKTLLTIKAWINGQFLNTYWADGLIVATPTGSTAYSLSCNGPILTPDSENFVITPIASHNLTVRPIVVRDNSRIRIRVDAREDEFLVSLDSRVERISTSVELNIFKAGFTIQLVRLPDADFFETLREKLKWGLDIRN